MCDGISFLPDPHLERPSVDVSDNMHLTLVLQKRKARRAICQRPLASLIVDGKSDILDQRGPWTTLGLILLIRSGRSPHSGQIDLAKCRDAHPQGQPKTEKRRPAEHGPAL